MRDVKGKDTQGPDSVASVMNTEMSEHKAVPGRLGNDSDAGL